MLLSYSKANENDAMDDSKDEVNAPPTKATKKSAKKRKSIENEESTEINDDVMEDEAPTGNEKPRRATTKEPAKEEDNAKKAPAKKGRKKAKNAA